MSSRISVALRGTNSGVHAIAFSHNGRRFASVGGDGFVRLWSTGDWKELAQASGGLYCLAFSPDDRILASCGIDRAALWSVEEPEFVAALQEHADTIGALQFSPDGLYLASGSQSRDVAVWDLRTGTQIARFEPTKSAFDDLEPVSHGRGLSKFAFRPDSKALAFADRGEPFGEGGHRALLVLWNFTGDGTKTSLAGHTSDIAAIAWHPNGRQIASADLRRVLLWDVQAASSRALRDAGGALTLAFDRPGTKLAAGTGDEAVVWDLASNGPPTTLQGHKRPVNQLLFFRPMTNRLSRPALTAPCASGT